MKSLAEKYTTAFLNKKPLDQEDPPHKVEDIVWVYPTGTHNAYKYSFPDGSVAIIEQTGHCHVFATNEHQKVE